MGKISPQAAFDREFRKHIERLTKPLEAALREITSKKPPSEVKILSFEMQADWRDFPVYLFAMDSDDPNEVYFEPPFCGQLLSKSGALIPAGAIDQDAYESAGVGTFGSGARVMAEWFGECWHAAGGAKFPIPAYINLHDSSRYFDLRKRRWVRDTDIWR
jgi:hypothetical protein